MNERLPRRLILLTSMAMLLFLAVCGGTARNTNPETASDVVRVTVRNEGFYDARIYLLRGAERVRLGTVNGNSTNTFTLRRSLVAGLTDLRFAVDWIGRRGGAASDMIMAQPGDEIGLIIR